MNYPKAYTVKEWKKFDKEIDGSMAGNQYQYFNFFTQRNESFESVTTQEILLQKYDVTLTDYKTKKEKLFQVIDKFSVDNLNKGIDKFNRGVEQFSKVIGEPKKQTKVKRKTKRKKLKEDDYTFLTNRKVKFF